jgi:hypothetical protein
MLDKKHVVHEHYDELVCEIPSPLDSRLLPSVKEPLPSTRNVQLLKTD